MVLDALKCNHLAPLGFKGLIPSVAVHDGQHLVLEFSWDQLQQQQFIRQLTNFRLFLNEDQVNTVLHKQ